MRILNLTQHSATVEQLQEGVFETKDGKELLRDLLTFETLPSQEELGGRAYKLAKLATYEYAEAAMIGGAPYLMRFLEEALEACGIRPLYAFSVRESVEETDSLTGEVRKTSVFRHLGFVSRDAKKTYVVIEEGNHEGINAGYVYPIFEGRVLQARNKEDALAHLGVGADFSIQEAVVENI